MAGKITTGIIKLDPPRTRELGTITLAPFGGSFNRCTPNKRIRRSHRGSNWRKVKIAVGSPPWTRVKSRDSLGNKNERDNSEVERRIEEEIEERKKERSEETKGRGTRSILREESEEVMDGTSVMVQPSISRTYTFIIYYSCRCADTPPSGALFLSLASIGVAQRPPVTKQRFRYKVHTQRLYANYISSNDGEIFVATCLLR